MIHETLYHYSGFDLCNSVCRVRVYNPANQPPVIVLSEIAQNYGTSVTNRAEWLQARLRETLSLPADAVFVEHYGRMSYQRPRPDEEEQFSRVTIGPDGDARWLHLPQTELETLIGEAWT